MNVQCIFSVLLIINAKSKSADAKRIRLNKDGFFTDISDKYNRHPRIDPSEINYYYKLLNTALLKKNLLKLLNSKKYSYNNAPFVDLTRENLANAPANAQDFGPFSEDYIDPSEIARHGQITDVQTTYNKPEKNRELVKVFDVQGRFNKVLKMLEQSRRMRPKQRRKKATKHDSESSSDSDENNSNKPKRNNLKSKTRSKHIPKRFQVINNKLGKTKSKKHKKVIDTNDAISDFEDDDNSETTKNSEIQSNEDNNYYDDYYYIQSPTRQFKSNQWRRRLKHFLPKRVHWNEKDIYNLQNYWINGPRGQYPAQYKTPY